MTTGIKYIIILAFWAFYSITAHGQARAPHSLYFMETIPQVSQLNPAHQPRANVYVAFPMLSGFGLDITSDIAFSDIFQKQGNNYYTPIENEFDYGKFYKSFGNAIAFRVGADMDLFGFGFRTRGGYFSFGVSEHLSARFAVPKAFLQIIDEGFPSPPPNSPPRKLDFSTMSIDGMAYMQFRLGYSYEVNDKLTVGMNFKPIMGQFAAATKIDNFHLTTSREAWTFEGDGKFYLSAPVQLEKDEDDNINVGDNRLDDVEGMDMINEFFNFNNSGIAFDIGATYQINERLLVSAALNNIGFISWKKDLSGVEYKGSYTYDASKITVDLSEDNLNFDELLDEVSEEIEKGLTEQMGLIDRVDKFRTSPPPVFYAGASYQLTRAVSASLLSRTTFWKSGVHQSFNLSVNLQPYSFVALTTGATLQVRGNTYLGGGFTFFLGPLQFYMLGDYIPAKITPVTLNVADDSLEIPFLPMNQKTLTYRLGLNLVFGKHGYRDKPMLNKGASSWN